MENETTKKTTKNYDEVNALNDCSLGVLHSLWYLVNSPMFVVMKKMEEFDNLSNFLIAASESKSLEFFNLDYAEIDRKLKEDL